MCISSEVSMIAFLYCSVTSIFLYQRNRPNDRWIAFLAGYLGTMQLLEYLMWSDQECSGLNQISTDLGFIHNILQPIVSLLVAYLIIGKIPLWSYIPLIAYLIYSLPKIVSEKKQGQCSKPCSSEKIGLSWAYTKTKESMLVWLIFTIALCSPLLLMKKNGLIYFSFLMGTYILSHFIAQERCMGSAIPSNGSWWCLMATMMPTIAYFIN